MTKFTGCVLVLQLLLAVGIQSQDVALPHATSIRHELNITSPTDDYVIENQRQYATIIVNIDAQLAAFKSSYEASLDTLSQQKDLLLAKMVEVENKIYVSELLSDVRKHCIQKYENNLTTTASAQVSINNCVQPAISSWSSYASSASNSRYYLNQYYTVTLVNALNQCKKSNTNPSLNYTNCALQAIATADTYTASNLKNFNTNLDSGRCTANNRIKQAIDCSFTHIYNAIYKIGEVTRLIESCSTGWDHCPKCDTGGTTTTPVPVGCPNQIEISLTERDFSNATINNPFRGLVNIDCLQINISRN